MNKFLSAIQKIVQFGWLVVKEIWSLLSRLVSWWQGKYTASEGKAKAAWGCGGVLAVLFTCSICSSILQIAPASTPTPQQTLVANVDEQTEEDELPEVDQGLLVSGLAEAESEELLSPTNTPAPTETAEPTTPAPSKTPEPTNTNIPAPTATEAIPKVEVNASSANVRSGPGIDYPPVGVALDGNVLTVLATNSSGDWYNVVLENGDRGWIGASVVEPVNSLSSVRVAATIPSPPVVQATSVPTTIPATAVPTEAPAVQATAVPQPTEPPEQSAAQVVIIGVNKRDEYVDIQNTGGTDQDLGGWVLVSEKGNQACGLGGVLPAGGILRIWALASDAGNGGYNCGFGSNIWNNSESDPAVLYDASGAVVSRR